MNIIKENSLSWFLLFNALINLFSFQPSFYECCENQRNNFDYLRTSAHYIQGTLCKICNFIFQICILRDRHPFPLCGFHLSNGFDSVVSFRFSLSLSSESLFLVLLPLYHWFPWNLLACLLVYSMHWFHFHFHCHHHILLHVLVQDIGQFSVPLHCCRCFLWNSMQWWNVGVFSRQLKLKKINKFFLSTKTKLPKFTLTKVTKSN